MIATFNSTFKIDGESMQTSLQILKNLGYSQIQCVKLLIEIEGFTLSDADAIVLNSSAWSQEREGNLLARSLFFEAIFKVLKATGR